MEPKEAWNVHDERLREIALGAAMSSGEFVELVDGVRTLGRLLLAFSRVKRESVLDLQGTRESDTEHTMMLAVVACAVAARHLPELDVGKIAQYALVHDLVEAYSGDTSTLQYDADYSDKKESEGNAVRRIEGEFAMFPWLVETLKKYEDLGDPEARFIKALDKAMPSLVINLTDGVFYDSRPFEHPSDIEKRIRNKHGWLRRQEYASDGRGNAYVEAVFALSIGEALREWTIARQCEKQQESR